MRRVIVASAIIMLTLPAGMCQTTRWVKVPCLTKEEYQRRADKEPPRVGKVLTGNSQKDNRIIAGSAKELRAWGRGNLQILSGCVG